MIGFCTNCGSKLRQNVNFCPRCGAKVIEDISNEKINKESVVKLNDNNNGYIEQNDDLLFVNKQPKRNKASIPAIIILILCILIPLIITVDYCASSIGTASNSSKKENYEVATIEHKYTFDNPLTWNNIATYYTESGWKLTKNDDGTYTQLSPDEKSLLKFYNTTYTDGDTISDEDMYYLLVQKIKNIKAFSDLEEIEYTEETTSNGIKCIFVFNNYHDIEYGVACIRFDKKHAACIIYASDLYNDCEQYLKDFVNHILPYANNDNKTVKSSSPMANGANLYTKSSKDMNIGDAVAYDNLYVGLSYVKKSDHCTYLYNYKNFAPSGHDYIYAFVEVLNTGKKPITILDSDFSMYADSQKIEGITDFIFSCKEDKVVQNYSYELDPGMRAYILLDFEVDSDWQELDFFYQNNNWHLTKNDVSTSSFDRKSIFNYTLNEPYNKTGDIVGIGNNYTITYDNVTLKKAGDYFSDDDYVIFMYTIQNNGNSPLDLSLVGYKMRAYQNGILLGNAEYLLNQDTINGYTNIFSVDNIQGGMNAKLFVAFPTESFEGSFYTTLDMGYANNEIIGHVNIEKAQ
ncbi:MAG: zinc-ribbon domain-containing protein [Erysipelotrichaceae bacterium]|nr:zinc-ribbon domain-containing protein [Erysipelotrichaceae bacterium]